MTRLKRAQKGLLKAQERLYKCRRNLARCNRQDRAKWRVAVFFSTHAFREALDWVWAEQNLEKIKRGEDIVMNLAETQWKRS